MPRNLHRLLFIACLLCLGVAAANPPIRLAAGEWPPFSGESLVDHGIACRIVEAAFAESGMQVEFSFLSWRRGFELAKRGKMDGAILWAAPDANDPDLVGSSTVIISDVIVLHRRDVPVDMAHLEQAARTRVAYPNGYGYEDIPAFRHLLTLAHPRPVVLNDDRDAVQALLNNRIDLYPIDRLVAIYLLNQSGPPRWQSVLELSSTPLSSETLVVVISRTLPDHDRIVASLNRGLASLRAKGLIAKWLTEAAAMR